MSAIANLVKTVALGMAISTGFYGEAIATPATFTWTPVGATPLLNGGAIVNANNLNVADFASITVNTSTGAFTETGALNVLNFLNGGNTVSSPGLGSTYSLYLMFNGTGTLSGIPVTNGTSSSGAFASLTYQLIGSTSGSPPVGFTVSNGSVTVTDPGTKAVLAYGNLDPGTGFLMLTKTANGYSPTANLNLTFNECLAAGQGGVCTADESGFFTAPISSLQFSALNFSATDTVTALNVVGNSAFINIDGGGGNQTFQNGTIPGGPGEQGSVPEPTSLTILLMSLLGLSTFRFCQRQ